MTAPSGSISIGVSVDASKLASEITSAVQDAMKEAVASVRAGVADVERSVNSVDATGFSDVSASASDAMSDAAKSADGAMDQVQRSISGIDASGFNDVAAAADAAGASASAAIGDSAADATASISSIDTSGLNGVAAAADAASDAIIGVGSAADTASGRLSGMGDAVGQATSGVGGLGGQAQDATSSILGLGGGSVMGSLGKMTGAVGAAVGGWKLLSGAIDSAGDTAATEASLAGLYGSAEAAADMMGRISDIASGSRIDSSAYNELAKGLGYLGVEGQQAEDIMRNVGKAVTGAGGDSSSLDSVVGALTRMQNEGKVTRQSLSQLSAAGVPILDSLATALGVEVNEVLDMTSEGLLDVNDVMGVLEEGTGTWMERLIEAGDEVDNTFGARWDRAKDAVMSALGNAVLPLLEAIGPALSWAADGVASLVGWFANLTSGDSPGWIQSVLDAVRPLGDAMADVGDVVDFVFTQAIELFQTWWAVAQPIFTDLWDLVVDLWEGALQPVFESIWTVLTEDVIPTIMRLWENVAQPVFTKFGELVSAVWEGKIQPVLGFMVDVIRNVLAPTLSWLYENVVGPTFRLIGAAIEVAWKLIEPIFSAIIAFVQADLGPVFSWLYDAIIRPVWDAISAAISGAWDGIIRPVWDAMSAALSILGDAFSTAWNNVIKPVWDALGTGIAFVWENVVSPAWDAMRGGLDLIKDSFSTAVGFIDTVWSGIKAIAANPVLFVVETVYQNGIKAVWDMLAGALGLPGLPDASGLIGGLKNFHTGGIYPGYTPGRDVGLIGVSGGEAIMRPEWTRAVGEDYIHAANAAARQGGVEGVTRFLGGYATGGIAPGAIARESGSSGLPYMGGYIFGGVVDLWDATGGRAVSAVASGWDAVTGAIDDAIKTGYRFAVNTAFDHVIDPIGELIPEGDAPVEQIPRKAFDTMTYELRQFLLAIADDKDDERRGSASGEGAEQWIPAIKEALAAEGFPVDDAHIQATMAQIMTESTGNQYAIQSPEVVDVNTGGNEAQGLVQVTPNTAAAMGLSELGGDVFDPVTNLRLGMRWIKAGHGGDLLGTWGHGHGYASGGPVWGPGSSTSDSILARLSNGEFVINAAATRENRDLLEAINAGWTPPAGLLHELLPGYAGGGFVTEDELIRFAQGVEGQPYVWGGVEWGDCSGAVSAIARYSVGLDPFGGRFATATQGPELKKLGFLPGLGPAGSLNIGWYNGGPYGGHTSATLPNGVNFEMGGARGDGQYGGQAAPADDPMYTDHMHLPPDWFIGLDPPDVRMGDTGTPTGTVAPAASINTGTGGTGAASGTGRVSTGGSGGAAGVRSAASAAGGGAEPSIIVAAIAAQTDFMGDLAADADEAAEIRQIDAQANMRQMVHTTVADHLAVPIYRATVDALGSAEAAALAVTIGEQVAETIADGIAAAESAIINGIVSIVQDTVGNLATGLIDAAFGETDEDAYGGPLFQALAKTVGAQIEVRDTLFAVAEELRGFRDESEVAYDHTGRIVSDTSALMQRTESSREQVQADREAAAKEMVRATLDTIVTKIVLPAIGALLAAAITAGFAALGTAIGGPAGTAIGGAVGVGLSGAVMGAVGGMFDAGGLARGMGVMHKGTIEPERVLSPRQTDAFERLVDLLDGRGTRTTTVHAPITVDGGGPQTATSVADRLLDLID